MNSSQQYKGFTLIELVITMAILGILASIAIPAYNGYIKTAKMTEAHNNLASIRLAEEEYFLEESEYFDGATTALVEAASNNLWLSTTGSDGMVNFDYAVVISGSGWTATATGKVGTSVDGETRSISKN